MPVQRLRSRPLVFALLATGPLLVAALACGAGPSQAKAAEPTEPVAPLAVGGDLTALDLCAAIPRADVEAVLDRKLASAPQRFEYYDASGTTGCWYEGAKDASGEAHFGYVALTPPAVYGEQPLYLKADVSGLGSEAYFNNGADARQLWVKVDERVAFVVAFGDVPKEDGCRALAQRILAAIR